MSENLAKRPQFVNAEQWRKSRKVPLHYVYGFDEAAGAVEAFFLTSGELNDTVGNGKNRVVFAHFYALAG